MNLENKIGNEEGQEGSWPPFCVYDTMWVENNKPRNK